MSKVQKFEIAIEYRAGDEGYTADELCELLAMHLKDYDTKVHSVREVGYLKNLRNKP